MQRTPAQELCARITGLRGRVVFPGRVRVFCAEHLTGLLDEESAADREWPGASNGALLAAAAGAAYREGARSGQVIVLCSAPDGNAALWWDAVALAGTLGLANLLVIMVDGNDQVRQRMHGAGWAQAGEPLLPMRAAPTVYDWQLSAEAGIPAVTQIPGVQRRAWQPVHLASLPVGGVPTFPNPDPGQGDADGAGVIDVWLAWLAAREAHLLIAHQTPPWRDLPANQALMLCLAQMSSDGLRVCWRVPAGCRFSTWQEAQAEISRRAMPVKVLVEAPDLPTLAHLRTLPGWWVMAPAAQAQTAAVLVHILDNEDAVLVGLPPPAGSALPIAAAHAYLAGSGIWMRHGATITLVCDSRTCAATLAGHALLAQAGISAGVLVCTSLQPLPVSQLREASARGVMLVVAYGDGDEGLGGSVRREFSDGAAQRIIVIEERAHGGGLTEAIVAQVRAAVT